MSDIDYDKVQHYLATLGVGPACGSWALSKTSALDAINRVVKIAQYDWKIFGKGYVAVYDVTDADEFTTEGHPRNTATKQPLPYLYSVSVDLPKPKKRR